MPDLTNTLGIPNMLMPQQQPPVMTPGGGTTGAPLQPTPTAPPFGDLQAISASVLGGGFAGGGHSGLFASMQDGPGVPKGPDHDAWRQAMMDWRNSRPGYQGFRATGLGQGGAAQNPLAPPNPLAPQVPPQATPQMPPQVNQALPPIPVGGVGTSYGVIGATPATGQFGLPTY